MKASTLRPGFLVVVRTSIRGNTSYVTTDLGTTVTADGAEEARWETNRLVRDKAEQERAVKARALARSAIQTVCAHSDFGLLCPQDKGDRLDGAIAKAQGIVDEFNDTSELTRISFNVMCGTVAPDDARAIRAINSEMRELIEDMQRGINSLDVDAVRKAANKATSVGKMLETGAQETVKKAITLARAAATEIRKAGDVAAVEIDQATMQRLTEARLAFLDLEEAGQVGEVVHVAPAVDLEPEAVGWDEGAPAVEAPAAPTVAVPRIDW